MRAKTISADYLKQQIELHTNPDYGVASVVLAPVVKDVMEKSSAKSLSDYGAGKCRLQQALCELGKTDFDYFPFDPAFPEYGDPKPADLVCCIDVLEHIEPEFLDPVLADLQRITVKFGVFTIHTGLSTKFLNDGRNAHLIQKPSSWWLPLLCQRFEIERLETGDNGFLVGVTRREPGF